MHLRTKIAKTLNLYAFTHKTHVIQNDAALQKWHNLNRDRPLLGLFQISSRTHGI